MKKLLCSLLLVLFVAPLWASNLTAGGTVGISYSNGVATVGETDGASILSTLLSRSYAAGSTAGTAVITETESATLLGQPLSFAVQRSLSAPEVAVAVAAVGASAYAGCAAGTAIAQYAGMGSLGGNGARVSCNVADWLLDDGTAPSQITMYTAGGNSGTSDTWGHGATPGDACTQNAQNLTSSNTRTTTTTSYKYTYTVNSASETSCNLHRDTAICPVPPYTGGCQYSSGDFESGMTHSAPQSLCHASIDSLNPAFSVAEGSNPGPDGKCPTGRYSTTDPATVADRLQRFGDATHAVDALKHAMDNAPQGTVIPISDSRHVVSTNPTSYQGQPTTTTTTNPDGTTSTSTTTPTYYYNTNNNNTITISNTQTTTNSDGSSTTTSKPPDQPTDPCELHPNSAGCVDMGTPPSAEQIPNSQETITYSAVSFTGGSCPAPITWAAFGHSYSIEFDPLCNLLSTLAALFLFTGAAAAALIIMDGFKV